MLRAAQHDDRRRRVALGELGEQIEAAAAGHHEIEQDQVGRRFRDRAQRFVDARRGQHLALVLEQHPQRFAALRARRRRPGRAACAELTSSRGVRAQRQQVERRRPGPVEPAGSSSDDQRLVALRFAHGEAALLRAHDELGEHQRERVLDRGDPWHASGGRAALGAVKAHEHAQRRGAAQPRCEVLRREVDVAALRHEREAGSEQRVEARSAAARDRRSAAGCCESSSCSTSRRRSRISVAAGFEQLSEQRRDVDRFAGPAGRSSRAARGARASASMRRTSSPVRSAKRARNSGSVQRSASSSAKVLMPASGLRSSWASAAASGRSPAAVERRAAAAPPRPASAGGSGSTRSGGRAAAQAS